MTTETQTALRVEQIEKALTLDAKLFVPFSDSEVAFAYPSFGPDTYAGVRNSILEHDLSLPTGDQTAALLHAIYIGVEDDSNSSYSNDIKEIMKNRWICSFQVNNWISEGVYIEQDLEVKGLDLEFNRDRLEGLLDGGTDLPNGVRISEDRKVRFAPKCSYKLGEHTPDSLAQDGFVIASYGKDGARKLADISTKFSYKPRTWGIEVNDKDESEKRVSALNGYNGNWLSVNGFNFGDDGDYHAFGVLE